MAHSVGEQAARAVKNSERKAAVETRTPAEILKGIRGNLTAHLAVTPNDIQFLLTAFDAEKEFSHKLAEENFALKTTNAANAELIAVQQTLLDQFRAVYEQENSSTTVKVEQVPDVAR